MSLTERTLRHIGGRTCLDFVNTANWSASGDLIDDKLETDEDIAIWCRVAGLADVSGTRDRLDAILRFRGSLRRVLLAAMSGTSPADEDLAALNDALSSLPHQTLHPSAEKGTSVSASLTLDQAVAVSAMALLNRQSEIGRVKVCPGDNCAWMFLDESKNRRRTWCSMDACGNRAKAKRHYRRKTTV